MARETQSVDVTSETEETYNSSHLVKFAWVNNPIGDQGFLVVTFQTGDQYIYMGVPENIFEDLESRATEPERHSDTVGQYFNSEVRDVFRQEGVDYQKLVQ